MHLSLRQASRRSIKKYTLVNIANNQQQKTQKLHHMKVQVVNDKRRVQSMSTSA